MFHFSSIPQVNNNQTIPIDYYLETSQGATTTSKGKPYSLKEISILRYVFLGMSSTDTMSDPVLNIDNVLNCRANTILSFSIGGIVPNGIIISMDIRPLAGGPATQTLFSIRDSSTNVVPFWAEIEDDTGYITFYRKNSGGTGDSYQITTLALQKRKYFLTLETVSHHCNVYVQIHGIV